MRHHTVSLLTLRLQPDVLLLLAFADGLQKLPYDMGHHAVSLLMFAEAALTMCHHTVSLLTLLLLP